MNRIVAVSGFLGLPSDWDLFEELQPIGIDPLEFLPESEEENLFSDWVRLFHQDERTKRQRNLPSILIGYSLGGRLALHALIDRPDRWDAAVIVSAHPGLKTTEERMLRLSDDRNRADLFLDVEWKTLMKMWNARPVFGKNRFEFDRRESDYSRFALARALTALSLGRQKNLVDAIADLPMPILWMTGEEDTRFCALSSELRFAHPLSRRCSVSDAGHRVLWDRPDDFREELHRFLASVFSPNCETMPRMLK